jgi:hypothetical protein
MTEATKKSLIKYIGKRLSIGVMQLVCVIYLGHCVIETVPQDKYRVIEGINNVTHDWLDAAKEKRDRDKVTEVAENAVIPVLPAKESAIGFLPDKRNIKDLP